MIEKPKDPAAGWTHEGCGVWVPPLPPSELAPSKSAGPVGSLRCDALLRVPCRACEIFGDGPCSPKAFEHMQNKVARAIHAEHNRHEGQDTPWIGLHRFQRDKYRGKAYAALVALGIPAPASANANIPHQQRAESAE